MYIFNLIIFSILKSWHRPLWLSQKLEIKHMPAEEEKQTEGKRQVKERAVENQETGLLRGEEKSD